MTIHGDILLRDLANAGESVRLVLDRAGLDYCCSGKMTLRDACKDAGLDLTAIEEGLGTCDVAPADAWARRGVTALVDHIAEVVHPRTKRLLEDLVAACAALPKREASARELSDATELFASHARAQMQEEESVLFARARALAEARKGRGPFPSALRTIHQHQARLQEGHATTHAHLRRIDALAAKLSGPAGDRVRGGAEAVARAMTEQIHLENNELIPRVLDLEPGGREVH